MMSTTLGLFLTVILATLIIIIANVAPKLHRRNLEERPTGLFDVVGDNSASANDYKFEIIAVHGLAAHPTHTWEARGTDDNGPKRVHLLRDLLHNDFPSARILSFAYNSDWLVNAPRRTAQTIARNLVKELENHRNRGQRVPMVLIGHSFGGIVIKETLLLATSELLEDVRAIIFLGTPHQGSSLTLAGTLVAMATGFLGSDTTLLLSLRKNDGKLTELEKAFRKCVTTGDSRKTAIKPEIVSFYETKPTLWLGWLSLGLVVDQNSAMGCSPRVEDMSTDHSGLNKFNTSENENYCKLEQVISNLSMRSVFEQAVDHLHDKCYTDRALRIVRLSGEALPMEQCYINLAIVEKYAKASDQNASSRTAGLLSMEARQRVETPNERLQVKLADLFRPRTGETSQRRRILIRGRAGVGKTTLCKKIIHDFKSGEIWKDRYDCIIWVPLRNLLQRPGAGYNLEQLFCDEFFFSAQLGNGRDLSRELNASRRSRRLLYLLDGWDEISRMKGQNSDMFRFVTNELFQLPDLIITSRPSASLPSGIDVDLELETIGFYPRQVNEYITKNQLLYADEIIEFLDQHPLVQSLARVPILVEGLCYSWLDIRNQSEAGKPQTMTGLYQAIQTSLWRKDITRLEKKQNNECIQTEELQGADQGHVERYVQGELHFLEHLAFVGITENVIEFEQTYLNRINKEGHDLLLGRVLPYLSLLRSSGKSAQPSYHFIHLTYQEYFAARYFVRHWNVTHQTDESPKQSSGKLDVVQFLGQNKYNPRYNVMLRFIAGLLDALYKDGQHQATAFFQTLEAEPNDLLGLTHQRIVMHCLAETVSTDEGEFSSLRKGLEQRLGRWVSFEHRFARSTNLALEPEFPTNVLVDILTHEGDSNRKIRNDVANEFSKRQQYMPRPIRDLFFSWLGKDSPGILVGKLGKDSGILVDDLVTWMRILRPPLSEDEFCICLKHVAEDNLSFKDIRWHFDQLPHRVLDLITDWLQGNSKQLQVFALDILEKYSLGLRQCLLGLTSGMLQSPTFLVRRWALKMLSGEVHLDASQILRHKTQELGAHDDTIESLCRLALHSIQIPRCINKTLDDRAGFARRTLAFQPLQEYPILPEHILQALAEQCGRPNIDHETAELLKNQEHLSDAVLSTMVEKVSILLGADYPLILDVISNSLRKRPPASDETQQVVARQLEGVDKDIVIHAAKLAHASSMLSPAVKNLVELWKDEREFCKIRSSFYTEGGRTRLPAKWLRLLATKLSDPRPVMRARAVILLEGYSALAIDLLHCLVEALGDEERIVRFVAAEVLEKQSALPEPTQNALAEKLGHENEDVRLLVLKVLGAQSSAPFSLGILHTIQRQVEFTGEYSNVSAQAVHALGTQPPLPREALLTLIAATSSKDSRMRYCAFRALYRQKTFDEVVIGLLVDKIVNSDSYEEDEIGFLASQQCIPASVFESIVKRVDEAAASLNADQFPNISVIKDYPDIPEQLLQSLTNVLRLRKWCTKGNYYKLFPAIKVLTGRKSLYRGISSSKDSLHTFYEVLLYRGFKKPSLWIGDGAGSHLVVEDQRIGWEEPLPYPRELELIKEFRREIVDRVMPDKTWDASELWQSIV